jgi:hypothetical protein
LLHRQIPVRTFSKSSYFVFSLALDTTTVYGHNDC